MLVQYKLNPSLLTKGLSRKLKVIIPSYTCLGMVEIMHYINAFLHMLVRLVITVQYNLKSNISGYLTPALIFLLFDAQKLNIFSRHSQKFDSYVSQIQFNALTVFYIITLNQTKSVLYTKIRVQIWFLSVQMLQVCTDCWSSQKRVSVNRYRKTVNK